MAQQCAAGLAGSGGMRPEVAELVDRLRAARRAGLVRVVAEADLSTAPPPPEPEVVEPYRWFLTRVAKGVKLTGAGYLPPAVVIETMQTLGWADAWIGAGN